MIADAEGEAHEEDEERSRCDRGPYDRVTNQGEAASGGTHLQSPT